MKEIIGKQIENVYENMIDGEELLFEFTDGTFFSVKGIVISYERDVEVQVEEVTEDYAKEYIDRVYSKGWK